jgi:hypothetical protein
MDFPHGEAVTRLRGAAVTDPYSGEATGIDWATPDELDIPGCGFNPGESSEPLRDARNAVLTQPAVYAPFGSDVLAGDRLVVRGGTYDVDGTPADWRSPFTGWEPGMVIPLKRTEG